MPEQTIKLFLSSDSQISLKIQKQEKDILYCQFCNKKMVKYYTLETYINIAFFCNECRIKTANHIKSFLMVGFYMSKGKGFDITNDKPVESNLQRCKVDCDSRPQYQIVFRKINYIMNGYTRGLATERICRWHLEELQKVLELKGVV